MSVIASIMRAAISHFVDNGAAALQRIARTAPVGWGRGMARRRGAGLGRRAAAAGLRCDPPAPLPPPSRLPRRHPSARTLPIRIDADSVRAAARAICCFTRPARRSRDGRETSTGATLMMNLNAPRTRRALAGAMLAVGVSAGGLVALAPPAQAHDAIPGAADLVEQVAPAVVYIEVTGTAAPQDAAQGVDPFGPGGPFERFFGQRMPQNQQPQRPEGAPTSVGSGFIIDANGEIVTNNHVVAGASQVTVKLTDGRSFAAKVIGADPMSDLALIKIEDANPLPHVAFGDSDKMRPGDSVIAVGNPFGLGGTVTTGIVSAMARNINAGPYDDYIQTDAAINHGNSGGPLFNATGEVIGVNSAIVSPTGGSVGIGFAVPSSIAKSVIAQIRDTGAVSRGWLGVRIQPVTPELADALGLDAAKGALVADVTPSSPAAAAGLQAGDVIVSFGGKDVADMAALPKLVAALAPGASAEVAAIRGGDRVIVSVLIGDLGASQVAQAADAPAGPMKIEGLGVELASLDDAARAALGLDADARGVVIAAVDPEGAAASKLRAGDLVISVDGAAVNSPAEVRGLLASRDGAKAALLIVKRGGSDMFVGIRLKQA